MLDLIVKIVYLVQFIVQIVIVLKIVYRALLDIILQTIVCAYPVGLINVSTVFKTIIKFNVKFVFRVIYLT